MTKKLLILFLMCFALSINVNATPRHIVLSYGLVSSIEDDTEIVPVYIPIAMPTDVDIIVLIKHTI